MTTETQEQIIDKRWLYGHGYTMTQAARVLGCSVSHLARVLDPEQGTRSSNSLIERVRALPARPSLKLRRTRSDSNN